MKKNKTCLALRAGNTNLIVTKPVHIEISTDTKDYKKLYKISKVKIASLESDYKVIIADHKLEIASLESDYKLKIGILETKLNFLTTSLDSLVVKYDTLMTTSTTTTNNTTNNSTSTLNSNSNNTNTINNTYIFNRTDEEIKDIFAKYMSISMIEKGCDGLAQIAVDRIVTNDQGDRMIKITNQSLGHSSYSIPGGVVCKDSESVNLLTRFREHGYSAFRTWLGNKSNVNKIDFQSPGYQEILGDSKGTRLKKSFLKRMALVPVKKTKPTPTPTPKTKAKAKAKAKAKNTPTKEKKKLVKKIEKKVVESESESESESKSKYKSVDVDVDESESNEEVPLRVFNLNPHKIRETFETYCTEEIFDKGLTGISEFIIKEILKDRDGNLLVKNTNPEEGCLEYLNTEGVACKDQGFEKLLEVCRPIYTEMNLEYKKENNAEYYTFKRLYMVSSTIEFDVNEIRVSGDGGRDHMMIYNLLSYFNGD